MKKLWLLHLILSYLSIVESKKLSFLFGEIDKTHSNCPFKHYVSTIKDLCFLFYKNKKYTKSALEICNKNSHRLATLDNDSTWKALKYSINTFYLANNLSSKHLNNRFHMGYVYRIDSLNYFWNHSHAKIDMKYFCSSKKNKTIAINSNMNCLELIYNDENYESIHDRTMCLKLIDCSNARLFICEWHGGKIQDYSLELRSQIINAYVTILCVASLFSLIWTFLWFYHKKKFDKQIMLIMTNYLDELKLLNMNVNDNGKDV
jgi:hypothetical protein